MVTDWVSKSNFLFFELNPLNSKQRLCRLIQNFESPPEAMIALTIS